MAVTQSPPPPGTSGTTRTRNRRPKQNFETWSWFFMRISGLVLVFLALFHFALTHIINDVVETDHEFVVNRWSNPLWRLYDWTLLALALLHGLNGVRWSIDDYVQDRAKRAGVKSVVYLLSGVLFAYGTFTIITFAA